MKDMFFDGGHGSPSVVKRIRNAANKTTLGDSKHTQTQFQEQETLSGWSVTGRVSFADTIMEDSIEIPDLQVDTREGEQATKGTGRGEQEEQVEFE